MNVYFVLCIRIKNSIYYFQQKCYNGNVSNSIKTRSYLSKGNSVSFPEKAEKGWGFDILCIRQGLMGICANAPLCAALIRSVARGWEISSWRGVVLNLFSGRGARCKGRGLTIENNFFHI